MIYLCFSASRSLLTTLSMLTVEVHLLLLCSVASSSEASSGAL